MKLIFHIFVQNLCSLYTKEVTLCVMHAEVHPVNAGKMYVKYVAKRKASVAAEKKKSRVHALIKKAGPYWPCLFLQVDQIFYGPFLSGCNCTFPRSVKYPFSCGSVSPVQFSGTPGPFTYMMLPVHKEPSLAALS